MKPDLRRGLNLLNLETDSCIVKTLNERPEKVITFIIILFLIHRTTKTSKLLTLGLKLFITLKQMFKINFFRKFIISQKLFKNLKIMFIISREKFKILKEIFIILTEMFLLL